MKSDKKFYEKSVDIRIIDHPVPTELFFPVSGHTGHKNIKPGVPVKKNVEILPGLISPVNGRIKGISELPVNGEIVEVISIGDIEGNEIPGKTAGSGPVETKEVPLQGYAGMKLADVPGFQSDSDIVISAVDPDPMGFVFRQLLRENSKRIGQCFDYLKTLFPGNDIHLAVGEELFDLVWELETSGISVHKTNSVYPRGIPQILMNGISEKRELKSPLYLTIEEFLNICDFNRGEDALFFKVITVNDINGFRNIRVLKGTPLKEILENSEIRKAAKVIVGGPMRGYTVYDLKTPVTDLTDSVYVQYEKDIVRSVNNQCINCGECNHACPVSLSVNLITRYSEFSLFEKCRDLGVEYCIECGLCSYYCPAGRSLLQLIRLAKREIKELEGDIEK